MSSKEKRKKKLISVLKDGIKNSLTSTKIQELIGTLPSRTEEPTRDLIRECIMEDKYPIGSYNKGYFLINTQEELDKVIKSLENRIDGIEKRIKCLKNGWERREEERENLKKNWPKKEICLK